MSKNDLISRLTQNRLTYSEARNASKLSLLASFFVLFKSTVGLGLFSYPYVFSKVGVVYGLGLGLFICYITTYGMYTLASLPTKIESIKLMNRFESYDGRRFSAELVGHLAGKAVGPRAAKVLSTLCIIGCVIINGSVIVGAVIEIGDVLSGYFGTSKLTFKLIIICVYLVLSALIIEPEKLKPYAFVSSGVVISIGRPRLNSRTHVRHQRAAPAAAQCGSRCQLHEGGHQPDRHIPRGRRLRIRGRGHGLHE